LFLFTAAPNFPAVNKRVFGHETINQLTIPHEKSRSGGVASDDAALPNLAI
jgi:hypothetical protein